MKNRVFLLLIMCTTWACAFISEPDVGFTDPFDFEPEGTASGGRDNGQSGVGDGSYSPDTLSQACDADAGLECESADAGEVPEAGEDETTESEPEESDTQESEPEESEQGDEDAIGTTSIDKPASLNLPVDLELIDDTDDESGQEDSTEEAAALQDVHDEIDAEI